jgi:dTDP-glucose pyrophosphorylase
MISHWNHITLNSNATIKEAMETLNATGVRIVLIADQECHLIATVTDGDIRRGLLRGINLEMSVTNIMNNSPIFVSPGLTKDEVHDILRHTGVLAVPIVDEQKKILGLETIDCIDQDLETETLVVLMAGGFGKRLMPLTENVPKPMLPLGDSPILEHIVENLRMQGFKNFCITTHYKSEIIQQHFDQKKYVDINIDFIIEDEPLGTAGALFLLKNKVNSDFIVMNSDLLLKTNFRNLVAFHQKHKEIATICTKQYNYQVPYGVVCLENMAVSSILEKPTYSHLINAGAYCFNHSVFNYMPEKKYMDMPTLLQNIIKANKKVYAYPIHEYWVDIGTLETLTRAREEYSEL